MINSTSRFFLLLFFFFFLFFFFIFFSFLFFSFISFSSFLLLLSAKFQREGKAKEIEKSENEEEDSILVFAQHKDVLDALEGALNSCKQDYMFVEGISHFFFYFNCFSLFSFSRIDGQTPPNKRQELVNHFQTTPRCRVALLSITAAGVGLTLTKATAVIFAEV